MSSREEDIEFNRTFDSIKDTPDNPEEEDRERAAHASLAPFYSDVATRLDQEFSEAETDKSFIERRLIRDLRQYRGKYDPEVKSKMNKRRSQAFIRLTRTKVKFFDARMMDIMFPLNGDKNWAIHPTPVPELSQEMKQNIAEQIYEATGNIPTEEEIEDIIYKAANKKADEMSKEIEDQLTEFKYRDVIRNVLHSGHVYGTGILKGPLIKDVTAKRWYKSSDNTWSQIEIKRSIPIGEFVEIWDIYPDMSAKTIEDCRYVWQKSVLTKNKFLELAERNDFNGKAIKAFIDVYPDGNTKYRTYEEDFREMSTQSSSDGDNLFPKKEKYELHERWGYIKTEDAKDLMPEVSQEKWDELGRLVACNIWMVDNIVIKAVISPIDAVAIPYYLYYFDKDETSIFGDGIPRIMRDPQMLYNASVRAMLDNAAISAGPLIETNIELLADGEDPLDLYPFRVFQRIGTGIEANQQAIRVTKLPAYTNEYLKLTNFFQETASESTTIPRPLGPQDKMSGSMGHTATGISMVVGGSNITLKDQVTYFDDGITIPFIKAMYFWNMEFNTRQDIKGDFDIVARGSKSLVAKEVKMEQINRFLQLTQNPEDAQYIKRDVLYRELAEIFDLEHLDFIKSDKEVAAQRQSAQMAQKQESDKAIILEAMKAESSGHVPNAVAKIMQLLNIEMPGNANNENQPQ